MKLLESLVADVRYAVRSLRKSPGFTAVAILTLALGIGANTAVFSLVQAFFLQPLNVPHSEDVVHIYRTQNGQGLGQFSFPDYLEYRKHTREVFSELAAEYATAPIYTSSANGSEQVNGAMVTSNYFPLTQVRPAVGRFFLPEEDEVPGRNPVVVISHAYWQKHFGGDAKAIGQQLRLNAADFTIVGVAPQGFGGVLPGLPAAEVWIPTAMFRVGYHYCGVSERDCHVLILTGRLRPAQTIGMAQAACDVEARRLERAYLQEDHGGGAAVVAARGVQPPNNRENVQTAGILSVVVGAVLLIACANVAGLLLARATGRRREIAIRLAIGAGPGRLFRQLLTETLVLALPGGALGLLVAFWTQRILLHLYARADEMPGFGLSLNGTVQLVTLGLSLLTGVVFGLAPARQCSRLEPLLALKDSVAGGSGGRLKLRDSLVIAQVALSMALLICSGLLTRSLQGIYGGAGYDPSHLLWLRLRPSLVNYPASKAWEFQREVLRRLEGTPGVVSASPESYMPIRQSSDDARVWRPGQAPVSPTQAYTTGWNQVGPRYFETLGVSLVAGREFDEHDLANAPAVAIANETLARHFWPGGQALEQVLVAEGKSYRIVGVVRDAQYVQAGAPPVPFLYTNYWQQEMTSSWPEDSRTLIRVQSDPGVMLPALRQVVTSIDPDVPISEDVPFSAWLATEFRSVRIATTFLSCFGALALLLSAIGLYGLLAFLVGRRTREIGICMALGADRSTVAWGVLKQGAARVLVGGAVGFAAAAGSAQLLEKLLYGVTKFDVISFIAGPVILGLVGLAACVVPACRAMRVDPMVALRRE